MNFVSLERLERSGGRSSQRSGCNPLEMTESFCHRVQIHGLETEGLQSETDVQFINDPNLGHNACQHLLRLGFCSLEVPTAEQRNHFLHREQMATGYQLQSVLEMMDGLINIARNYSTQGHPVVTGEYIPRVQGAGVPMRSMTAMVPFIGDLEVFNKLNDDTKICVTELLYGEQRHRTEWASHLTYNLLSVVACHTRTDPTFTVLAMAGRASRPSEHRRSSVICIRPTRKTHESDHGETNPCNRPAVSSH